MWITLWRNFPDFYIAPHLHSGFSSVIRYLKKKKGSHYTFVGLSSSMAKEGEAPLVGGRVQGVLFEHWVAGWANSPGVHCCGRN